MSEHDNIARIAALSFREHVMEDAPAKSWRVRKPGTGCYAFRVTWTPGCIAVSGDIGRAVYELWPSFETVEGAIKLINRAGFDYLTSKSGFKDEFDRDDTVQSLLQSAYRDLRNGYEPSLFAQLCDEYGGDSDNRIDRKEAAKAFRDDCDLTAERVYNITGDFEAPSYNPPSEARWTFEAVKLWAAKMQAACASLEEVA